MQSSDKTGTVRIARSRRWLNGARAFKVSLDGRLIARVRNGRTEQFDVAIGDHVLHVKCGWSKSDPVAFKVEPGATVQFRCDGGEMPEWVMLTTRREPAIVLVQEPSSQ
jgi:hypothetical protein